MRSLRRLGILTVLALAACASPRAALPAPDVPGVEVDAGLVEPWAPPPLPVAVDFDASPEDVARDVLSTLTLRERVAQLVMPWIDGPYWALDHEAMGAALRLAADERVGGFVIGIGTSPYDVAAKLNALQAVARIPLLMAADLESGPSSRIRGGTAFPGNMALGASGREQDAYDVGRVIALEGRAVGLHMTFAPVVDVNNNPANPIINTRSFGEDPHQVGRLAAAFIRGLHDHGMLATAKHFPGHGDTGTDSHIALPVIAADRTRLDSVELVPFRMAVQADVDAVMSAHIALPALTGGSTPATFSSLLLDTLLRRDIGFRGLVVTDALEMGAIVAQYGAGPAAVGALQAGADILLMPTSVPDAVAAVVAAVERGALTEARVDASVLRILTLKARQDLFRRRFTDLSAIARVVGRQEHLQLARDITARTIVLARDALGMVPLAPPPDRRSRVLVVAYGDEAQTGVGTAFVAALRAGGVRPVVLRLWPASGPASFDSVRTAAAGATVVFVAAPRPAAWRPDAVNIPDAVAALVDELARAPGAPVIGVSFGSPYLLRQIPNVSAFLLAWAGTEWAERAAAAALLGHAPISGRMPVSLPPMVRIGWGIERR